MSLVYMMNNLVLKIESSGTPQDTVGISAVKTDKLLSI